jgi:hypothetical protein
VYVLGYVCEPQKRGVFHPHLVLGYRTAADRAALETFRGALKRSRGSHGFGTGRRGSFDGGRPDRFCASDAGRYISKYLRPDGAKTSFVPLLEAVNRITPQDPETGRHKHLVRPVYISPTLTRLTGVTMGFLRFRRWAWRSWGGEVEHDELVLAYRFCRVFGATLVRVGEDDLPTPAPPVDPGDGYELEALRVPVQNVKPEQLALPL